MKQQGKSQRNSCQATGKVALCVICLILCSSTIVEIGLTSKNLHSHSHQESFTYEILCDDMSLSVSEDLRIIDDAVAFRTDRNGRSICIFENLTYIVENAADRIHRQRNAQGLGYRHSLRCGNEDFAANRRQYMAFFNGGLRKNSGKKYNTDLEWKQSGNSTVIGDSFILNKGRLRVNTTSFFFIYCSLVVRHGSNITKIAKRRRLPYLYVSIRRRQAAYNKSISTSLLRNIVPICTERCNDTSTVHMGSHFLLNRDEEVFVQVSDFNRLDLESTGNVFGMYKLE